MPSPFPGMDPYLELEDLWGDVHATLTVQLRNDLIRGTKEYYNARIEEYRTSQVHQPLEVARFVNISKLAKKTKLTSLEVLSPQHKVQGHYRDAYFSRIRECLSDGMNVVELDLLRAGQRCLAEQASYPFDYAITIATSQDNRRIATWKNGDSIPLVEVPIDEGQVIKIDLGACLDRACQEGRYEIDIPTQ